MSGIIRETATDFVLEFKYMPRIVEQIKGLPGRRFNYEDKSWVVPKSSKQPLIDFARRNNFTFQGAKVQEPEHYNNIPPLPELTIDIPLKREMFPFQKTGVAYAIEKKRLIVGDTMGLGKTTQAFATIIGANAFPCLIICPSSLKLNWQREIEQYTSKKALILTDAIRNNFHLYYEAGLADFIIVNYESLKKYFVERVDKPANGRTTLKHVHFKDNIKFFTSVIIDESHRVKSPSTMQSKFTKAICDSKEYVLALTGTPVINKPKDLMSQLSIIGRLGDFGGYKEFVDRYCSGPREASNLKELNYLLNKRCFYRRDKSQVLKDLPAKTRQVILCDISTRKEYNEALQDLEEYMRKWKNATDEQIAKSMKGEVMVRIGILKNISARGKIKEVSEFIDDTLEQGEKLGVFAHQHQVIDQLKDAYPGTWCITGRENIEQRQRAVDAFQNDHKAKLIFLGIQAAGVGLTLTAASRCAFIELGWHSAIHDQCEDRFHRIGQEDNVTCTYFLGKDTIDEWIYQIIQGKREVSNTITGAEDDVNEEIIDRMWTLFNQPK